MPKILPGKFFFWVDFLEKSGNCLAREVETVEDNRM